MSETKLGYGRESRSAGGWMFLSFVLLVMPALSAEAQSQPCSPSTFDFASSRAAYPPDQPPPNGDNWDCKYDRFAWETFIALNFPAIVPAASNGYKRGFPDQSASFISENDPDLTVWETWKAKREIFRGLQGNSGMNPGPWNSENDYGPDFPAQSFTVCSDAPNPAAVREALAGGFHTFAQSSKILSEGLDEHIEVNGEAFYPASIRGDKAEPEVFKTSSGHPVLYEVKVNYDWFNYVVGSGFYDSHTKTQAAQNGTISFPARTSSYNGAAGCNASTSVPCAMGAIETKSAWVLAGPGDDISRYHSTPALYFKADSSGTSGLCADVGTFLMTGLHINQKTDNQPFFIYSTFGHVDNAKDNNEFRYQNEHDDNFVPPTGIGVGYITSTSSDQNGQPIYGTSRIRRQTQLLNQQLQSLIRASNPNSVWQYYELVGVQFATKDADETSGNYPIGSNDPGYVGQSYYLANLTLETSWGLQNFQGTPPMLNPISRYQSSIPQRCKNLMHYDRNCPNIVNPLNNTVHNTGGCMGCHGIAQLLGYDFSFVLLVGGGDVEPAPPDRPTPCHGTYCSSGQVCTDGGCCSSGNACGSACCQSWESCESGTCVAHCSPPGGFCSGDQDCCYGSCAKAGFTANRCL